MIKFDLIKSEPLYETSFYVFSNGDGTKYTLHVMPAEYGGLYVICNESSLWRFHSKRGNELKHLCGNNNEYTKIAILQLADLKGWVE